MQISKMEMVGRGRWEEGTYLYCPRSQYSAFSHHQLSMVEIPKKKVGGGCGGGMHFCIKPCQHQHYKS